MDFSITIDNLDGNPTMSWTKSGDISTNVWYTTNIEQGTFFQNPDFGVNLRDINKVTVNNIDLIKQRLEKAYNWLLTTGKAKQLIVIVEPDLMNINRVNYKIEIYQADGIPVTITDFVTVGGASDSFTI